MEVSWQVKMANSTAVPTNEQLQSIREILITKERPLSWEFFGQELEKCNSSFTCQSVQEALCQMAIPGVLSSRDFITLDTPRNVGLLKLQLAVAVNEKINAGRFSKANHYFHIIASDVEKDELGHNEDTLAKSFLEFDDAFHVMTSLSASVGSHKRVSLKPESALLHKSFFAFEKDKKTSAVHKVKYFLNLCHGLTDTWSAFEFSRCFLAKEEKVFFARNTIAEFVSALKSFKVSLYISDNAVALSSSLLQRKETLTPGDDGQRELLRIFDEEDIVLFKDILQNGPLSWNCFLSVLESRKPGTYSIALREMLCNSSPNGLMPSPDFISLCDIRSTALVKLHFLVTINNKLGNGQLGKISYHFNVIAVEREKDQIGRNSKMISKSLLKYDDIFHLPSDGGDRCNVKCGPLAIPFDSFFQMEGNRQESFRHKLKYFLNLCGGTCTVFSAFEFSRNLLRSDEKQLFKCNQQSFVSLVSSLDDSFKVMSDKIQLCKSHLWFTPSGAASFTSSDDKHQASGGGDGKPTATAVTEVNEHIPKSLTVKFVTDTLKLHCYPMSWKEFMKKFMRQDTSDVVSTVETFLTHYYDRKGKKLLCLSKDFVALDAPYHRSRLKLALILENRSHCNKPNEISMKELKEQFEEIASREEIIATGGNYDSFCEFLGKFPMIFSVQSGYVRQGYRCLRFPSFFVKEKEGALPSVIHKLKYFVNICGSDSDVRFTCKFLQRHLSLKKELQLVDSDEKVLCLAQEAQSGKIKSHSTGTTAGDVKRENDIGNNQEPKPKKMLSVFDERDIALFKDILQEGPLSWKFFLSQLESRRPNTYSVALREMFSQSQPDGLINSPDFISLNDVRSTGLAKLHFIVSVNSKSGDVSLNKVSHHFSVFGSDEEREEFGRNSDGILQSLLKYKDVFLLPLDGGNQCSVKCGPLAIPFDSFFQLQGKSEESFNHKLKYFVNLCGGTCTKSSAFEFSRNLLSKDEKQLFMCKKESFFELVSSQKSFRLMADRIQLCKSHLWSTPLEAATLLPVDPKIPSSDDWFSEELGDPAGISVVLESSCDQEAYCLRKVDSSSICQVPLEEAESYKSNLSSLTNELIHQYSQSNTENIIQLLTLLGGDIFTTLSSKLKDQSERTVEDLSEITLHVGRLASARFHQKTNGEQPMEVDASSQMTTCEDLEEIEMKDALTGFDDYNRCGVEGCLHSIRRITNRKKKLIGLTVRVALPLLGCADMMYDIALSDKSTLILGRRGVGKTTLLRELARCLSDTVGNKVVVIDTCNEIAGDCDTPHFSIGRASRLQVDSPDQQHRVISESAKNHNPDVVIIDLIELPNDISAISRICKQGIKVIAGVSRDSVSSLLHDENLSQMFNPGSIDFLDDMSSLDSAGALTKSKLRPVFEALVEMKETDRWHIHDLMYTLSNVSNGQAYRVQERTRTGLNRRQAGWEQDILLREKVINPHDALH